MQRGCMYQLQISYSVHAKNYESQLQYSAQKYCNNKQPYFFGPPCTCIKRVVASHCVRPIFDAALMTSPILNDISRDAARGG